MKKPWIHTQHFQFNLLNCFSFYSLIIFFCLFNSWFLKDTWVQSFEIFSRWLCLRFPLELYSFCFIPSCFLNVAWSRSSEIFSRWLCLRFGFWLYFFWSCFSRDIIKLRTSQLFQTFSFLCFTVWFTFFLNGFFSVFSHFIFGQASFLCSRLLFNSWHFIHFFLKK